MLQAMSVYNIIIKAFMSCHISDEVSFIGTLHEMEQMNCIALHPSSPVIFLSIEFASSFQEKRNNQYIKNTSQSDQTFWQTSGNITSPAENLPTLKMFVKHVRMWQVVSKL